MANADDPLRFYYWPVLGALYRRRVELCLNECVGGERVLEVGFGAGITFPLLAERYGRIHGMELEAAFKAVRDGSGGLRSRIHLLAGGLAAMPYAGGSFDTVLLISVLEHLGPADLQRAVTEIHRVLKPGGQLVYGVPVHRPMMTAAFAFLGYDIRTRHLSTHGAVADAAGNCLQRVCVRALSPMPALLGPVYETGHFVKARGEGTLG